MNGLAGFPAPRWLMDDNKVQLGSLGPAARFVCIQGVVREFIRRDSASAGVIHVRGDGGRGDVMAATSLVSLVDEDG